MKNGIRLEGKKDQSLVSWVIRRFSGIEKIRVPLSGGEKGNPPAVREGAHVKKGTLLAHAASENAAPVYSGISGTVNRVGLFPHPVFGEAAAIEISASGFGEEKEAFVGEERRGWENLNREELVRISRDAGLFDLSPSMEPLHLKLAAAEREKPAVLILNACETEPYITADEALIMAHAVEILKGAEMLKKLTQASSIVIALENHKPEVAELLKSKAYFLKGQAVHILTFPAVYPQGDEKILLEDVFKDPLFCEKAKGTPFSSVYNVATAFALYEAVVLQKPFYERVVTLAGECMVEAKNAWLPLGVLFGEAVKKARGFLRPPAKLLMGGPMKGFAQSSSDIPVVPGTQAILALPEQVLDSRHESSCFRCGLCLDHCPRGVYPAWIAEAVKLDCGELAGRAGIDACIHCGNCSYICPAGIPLRERIEAAEKMIRENKKRGSLK